jgi:predicted secreted protein
MDNVNKWQQKRRNKMSRLGIFFISVSMVTLMVLGAGATPCLAAPGEVSVDGSASGTHIRIAPGDTLKITLSSNPSTGFSWAFATDNELGVLQFVGHTLEPPNILGGSRKDIWTFSSGNAGTAHLSLEYSQPWDGGTKRANTFELGVIVSSVPVAPVPATSSLSTGLMVAIFAAVIVVWGIWKTRQLRT